MSRFPNKRWVKTIWKEEQKAVNVPTGTLRNHRLCDLYHIEQEVPQSLTSVLQFDSISDEADDHLGTSGGGAEGDIRGAGDEHKQSQDWSLQTHLQVAVVAPVAS